MHIIYHMYVLHVCITTVSQIRNPSFRLPDLESPVELLDSGSPSRTPPVGLPDLEIKNIEDSPHSADQFFS